MSTHEIAHVVSPKYQDGHQRSPAFTGLGVNSGVNSGVKAAWRWLPLSLDLC
jgi:hypothetical protein